MLVQLIIVVETPQDFDPESGTDPLTSAVSNLEYDGFKVVRANEVELPENTK
jgi:hypothetical protein